MRFVELLSLTKAASTRNAACTMSWLILIGTCCAALFCACHHDHDDLPEKPVQREVPISFRETTVAPQSNTRASGLEEKGVHDFYVWSYKTTTFDPDTKLYGGLQTIMEQYKVQWTQNTAGTTTSNVADWEYVGLTNGLGQKQNIKYWDELATSYRFFGIAPCSATGITYGKNVAGDEYDITFHADATDVDAAPYISALWITNNKATEFPSRKYKDVVTMEFMKPVTKVRIQLINELGQLIEDPADAGVTSLTFEPTGGGTIVQKGTLKVSYPLQGAITFTQYLPKLTIEGDPAGSLTINRTKAIDPNADDDYTDWYYVLPHILQNAFQLKLTVYDKPRIATVPAEYMSWNPNMEYTYKFKLTASEVQFIDIVQIGVTSWTTENSTHDIYNW